MNQDVLPKEKYHEVFVPFPDVYELGGPEAFRYMERRLKSDSKKTKTSSKDADRNLIVLPFSFVNTLSELENEHYSASAADALKYVKGRQEPQSRIFSKDGLSLYRLSQGLDLMIIDTADFINPNFRMIDLETKVKEHATFNEFKIITNDSKNHIRYSGMGLKVEDPEFLQVNEDIVHEGIITGNDKLLSALLSNGNQISLKDAESILGKEELYMNQFVRFPSAAKELFARVTGNLMWNKNHTRISGVTESVLKLLDESEYGGKKLRIGETHDSNILGISPRDMEQYISLQYGLMNKDISVFFLCGKAGSGKTLLTYAAAVDSILSYDPLTSKARGTVEKKGFFRQITLLKPPEILGGSRRDPGALPGSLLDKLSPHLRPYSDAHHETTMNGFLFDEMFRHPVYANRYGPARTKDVSDGKIRGFGNNSAKLPAAIEAIDLVYSGFIGGASIRDTFIVLDEAQDFTPYEMKTIVERMAEGSKLIICGDPMQTRNPKCNVKMNGLTFAIKNYLPKAYSSLVYLNRNYRHQASEDADAMKAYNG